MSPAEFGLFGLPARLARGRAEALRNRLHEIWLVQFERVPAGLSDDLDALTEFFDPTARGQRLRSRLDRLRELSEPPGDGGLLWINIGDERAVVTSEGRAALYWLEQELASHGDSIISADVKIVIELQTVVLDSYRRWGQSRLRNVVDLLTGDGPLLHPAGVGAVLLLLINRSTTKERAVKRPKQAERRQALDEALLEPIDAFVRAIAPASAARREHLSFYSGYALTEARRRLGEDLRVDGDLVWLDVNDSPHRVEAVVIRELRRRGASADDGVAAFNALAAAYSDVRPRLAAFESAFERPSTTDAIRRAIREGLLK